MKFPECCVCDHVDKGEENFVAQGAGGKVTYEPVTDPTNSRSIVDPRPEKSRLQEFVKDFAKCAVRGCPCEVINPHSGEVFSAAYFIDPQLQRLSLKRSQPPETTFRELSMLQIKDVLDAGSAGSQFPEAVVNTMNRPGIQERIVVVSFMDSSPNAYILEGSQVDRDRFIMCLKILRLYAQTHGVGRAPS
eukprot:gb/GFBE01029572.1/.p1 GENE.gb/GFBE01029572.1/~~gb/GFBE01029572.1/.p1  ORF type:complete len:190 (+),score=38.47 gb/GFBE01029572.1/:1-570(+)